MKDIIFITELDQDIDDIIACEYLHYVGRLQGVVLDPKPKTQEGLDRVENLKRKGVVFFDEIPKCALIFVGGAFTKLARYLERNTVDTIVANGGYVGDNMTIDPLEKFKGKQAIRTFNFNMDVESTKKVLSSNNFNRFCLVGKNVCHSEKNSLEGIWKGNKFLKDCGYRLKVYKKLHDLLMVSEGLNFVDKKESTMLLYAKGTPVYTGTGKFTLWSTKKGGRFDVAIGWK